MNVLIDDLPSSLTVDGIEYAINTDYRFSLSTILAFEDPQLTTYEKARVMIENIFAEIPNNIQEAVNQCQYFLNGGKDNDNDGKGRLFSFSHDAGLIYAAFQATHGINLSDEHFHWWRFLNLFMDLGQDTTFCQLVALRKRHRDGKTTKDERQAIRDMGAMFEVPENKTMSFDDKKQVDELQERYRKAKEARNGSRL